MHVCGPCCLLLQFCGELMLIVAVVCVAVVAVVVGVGWVVLLSGVECDVVSVVV